MRSSFFLLLLFGLLCMLNACDKGLHKDLLLGKWRAVALYEKGNKLDFDLSSVYFEFYEDDRYFFQSTLKFSEAGHFYTSGRLLYTTDTTATAPFEKAVKVTHIAKDSITFLMNDQGIEKSLQLVKSAE